MNIFAIIGCMLRAKRAKKKLKEQEIENFYLIEDKSFHHTFCNRNRTHECQTVFLR